MKPSDPSDLAFWTRQRLERKEITSTEYRPDLALNEFKEGMVFHVALQLVDDSTKGQPAKVQE